MHAAYGTNDRSETGEAIWYASFPERPADPRDETPALFTRLVYGEARQPNWIAIGVIAAAHLLVFWALVHFDVIVVAKAKPAPLMVELIPLPVTPPPVPEEKVVPIEKVAPVVVAPRPIVAVPAPPPPVMTVLTPPPQQPTVQAPPAPAPPITAPDASAATLGNTAPRYPMEARRLKQEGTVRLRVVITTDGHVKEISVARSSGYASLDKAALEAVRKWRFRPGMQAGQAVEAVGFVPIPFILHA